MKGYELQGKNQQLNSKSRENLKDAQRIHDFHGGGS